MYRPDKVREAIILFTKAYEIFPNIVALNQIALGYEMIGEFETARECFKGMHLQAQNENNNSYLKTTELRLQRLQ
jgi:tetratricopeptide (TPR) repeat protein